MNTMLTLTVYTTGPSCGKCRMTKIMLDAKKIPYVEVNINENPNAYTYVTQDLGYSMAPVGLDDHYKGGERQWVKVKRRNTIDVVAGAVIGPLTHPEAVVVGLPIDGVLRIVGRSTALRGPVTRSLGALLRPPVGPHPWPTTVSPGAVDRFNAGRTPLDLTLIEPIVVEVSADVARSGHTFRHSVRFLRARPELSVGDIARDGLERQHN